MTGINTVLGMIGTANLGFTLMHEHIAAGHPGVREYPELLGPNLMDRILEALTQAKNGGIDTIVDPTTDDMGRNVKLLAEASRRSGVNIITTTGWFEFSRNLTGSSAALESVSADQFAQLFIRDIEKGISGTEIKAGIVKAASDIEGVGPLQENILRGVARAHLQTKVPIFLHSYALGQVGRKQLAILKDENVDLRKVQVAHCLDTTDIEYLTWLLDQGCYLGMERYPGSNESVSPLGRTRTMKSLIDSGYGERLLLSHDWPLIHLQTDLSDVHWKDLTRDNPYGFLYLKKVIFPMLLEMGVSEARLTSLCVDNPRKFFE